MVRAKMGQPSSRFKEQAMRARQRLAALPPGFFTVTRPLVTSKSNPPGQTTGAA